MCVTVYDTSLSDTRDLTQWQQSCLWTPTQTTLFMWREQRWGFSVAQRTAPPGTDRLSAPPPVCRSETPRALWRGSCGWCVLPRRTPGACCWAVGALRGDWGWLTLGLPSGRSRCLQQRLSCYNASKDILRCIQSIYLVCFLVSSYS